MKNKDNIIIDQYNNKYTIDEITEAIQTAHNTGYEVTIIINGEYYVMEKKTK